MKYYIIAGEASGDLHGSNLMRGLKQADAEAHFRFWGGDLMAAQGGTLVKHYRHTAVMGFFEVVMKLRSVWRNIRFCKKDILAHRPEVLILIDYPGFNFRMAKFANKRGIKVFYYIAPKVWAWKEKRVHRLKKYVDRLFVIFPFETAYFKRWGIDACYAGNPLVDSVAERLAHNADASAFAAQHGLSEKPIIAVLAGSRIMEINYILPRMLCLADKFPDHQFVVAAAPSIAPEMYERHLAGTPFRVVFDRTYELMAHAEAAVVASGTATLEAALIGVPQIVCYGGSELSYRIAKRLVKVKYISLVNLIMNAPVVAELIQHDVNPDRLCEALRGILPGGAQHAALLENYAQLHVLLGGRGAAQRIAGLMVQTLKG
ncbi:MAG: lipid-A-disaccharide synthase [Prevotellaceae bacterium]|jgi:lipid-A-disaccharide synthase|nr:lipid-A-disaccharide synthase [Prevotellaceae bacterium]